MHQEEGSLGVSCDAEPTDKALRKVAAALGVVRLAGEGTVVHCFRLVQA